jgi:hypothetical protein
MYAHSLTCLLKAGIRAPGGWSFLREKARMPRSEERVPPLKGGDEWAKGLLHCAVKVDEFHFFQERVSPPQEALVSFLAFFAAFFSFRVLLGFFFASFLLSMLLPIVLTPYFVSTVTIPDRWFFSRGEAGGAFQKPSASSLVTRNVSKLTDYHNEP